MYYCDYCYYSDRLFSIVAFEDSDIIWNEDDPKDNLGIVRIRSLPWSKIAYCSSEELFQNKLSSFDELQFDKADLPSYTLEKSKHNIIVGIFTDEDI